MLVDDGVSLKDMQELMGHRHFGTTLRHYAQATRRTRSDVGEKVAAALGFGKIVATAALTGPKDSVVTRCFKTQAPVAESVDATDLKSVFR